jgi:hypothetical protein
MVVCDQQSQLLRKIVHLDGPNCSESDYAASATTLAVRSRDKPRTMDLTTRDIPYDGGNKMRTRVLLCLVLLASAVVVAEDQPSCAGQRPRVVTRPALPGTATAGQVGILSKDVIFTPNVGGIYRISLYATTSLDTSATSGSIAFEFDFLDGVTGRLQTPNAPDSTTVGLSADVVTNHGNYFQGSALLNLKAKTGLTLTTLISQVINEGTGKWLRNIVIEQL